MGDGSLGSTFAELDLDAALDGLDLEELFAGIGPSYPPTIVVINGQNILINDHGGTLFNVLRQYAPNWYRVASEAYIAMYSWHGTVDARPLAPALALTLIRQAVDSFSAIGPNWDVEDVVIPIRVGDHESDELYPTSFDNSTFMDCLKKTVMAAQNVFYTRSMEVVRFLVLPCDTAPWQHPGLITGDRLVTPDQWAYVNNLVVWIPGSGYRMWHEHRRNEDGVTVLHWFDRLSLKYLIDTVHFGVASPGYLYIQELYANQETGGEEWGPLTKTTFQSMTWILATVYIYLWADVLKNRSFLTDRFTTNRRDAILEQQLKISILFKQILRKRLPGLNAAQNEYAYISLHRFMNTNPNLPFLI